MVEDSRCRGKSGLGFKIDFAKAYDHVNWDFSIFFFGRKVLARSGEDGRTGCLSSVRFSVLINGLPRGKFKSSRGL